jgi:hypothetical protein
MQGWHRVCCARCVRSCAFVLAALLLIGGCARRPQQATRHGRDADPFANARPAAAALVFEPSMRTTLSPEVLARDGRSPEAFVGYPEGVTEHFYLRWDDRQSNRGGHHGSFDRFERRAISEKVGVLYR